MNNSNTEKNTMLQKFMSMSLVSHIAIGIVAAVILATLSPDTARAAGLLGELFVKALKAVAPLLIFVLVTASVANRHANSGQQIKPILLLYLLGTLMAALVAVVLSFAFPVELILKMSDIQASPPSSVIDVLRTLLFKIVDNPINALISGNFIAIVAWAIGLGFALHHATDTSKSFLADIAESVTAIVKVIIRFAPLGIFGLVANTVAETGFASLQSYMHLLLVLISAMLIMALLVNPLIVWWKLRRNPYPLVLQCLKESGVTAFFTRSSAANIPVNINLCEKLNIDREIYSVSIPLGATINMAGAAITITVLTLAAAHTVGIEINLLNALLLSFVASISACGASGVAGGSLLLIPLACNLFGIDMDIAIQVVAIGFIVSVIQDSAETALNSSTDVLYTAAICRSE